SLDTTGHLRIQVRGLVFADSPLVDPPELIGRNDEEEFRGLVSCLTEVGDSVETAKVETGGFPATESGDSTIDAHTDLPNTCVAPIVFRLAGREEKRKEGRGTACRPRVGSGPPPACRSAHPPARRTARRLRSAPPCAPARARPPPGASRSCAAPRPRPRSARDASHRCGGARAG